MIVVGAVIVGGQDGAEQVARSVAHRGQIFAPAVAARPVVDQRNARAVGEDEGGNVDRIGGRMLALRLPTRDLAAIIAAEIFELDHLLPEMGVRERLNAGEEMGRASCRESVCQYV